MKYLVYSDLGSTFCFNYKSTLQEAVNAAATNKLKFGTVEVRGVSEDLRKQSISDQLRNGEYVDLRGKTAEIRL